MNFVDTHAHLTDVQFDPDRESVLQRAAQSGIKTIVEIADSPEQWEKSINLVSLSGSKKASSKESGTFPDLYWSCGFHPHYADRFPNFNFDIMKEVATSVHCVAVGEIGLDYVKSQSSKENQIALFRKMLEVAATLNKPVVIHCREAQSDTLRILKSFFGGTARSDSFTGVIHCFSGDRSFAEGCLDLGFCLGVDGPVTYPSAKNLREVIAGVPKDKIVLETDCPYLPPQNFRGKRNESSYLKFIAKKVAEIMDVTIEELSKITTENAKKLFRIKS